MKHTVLIIDDDAWQADEFVRSLTRAGYRTRVARHAIEAMSMIDTDMPDAVVLDIMLPGPNGIALLHEIHSHADLAKLPIVVVSLSPVNSEQLQPYGVATVIDKADVTPEALVAAVRGAIE